MPPPAIVLLHGQPVDWQGADAPRYRAYAADGRFIGLCQLDAQGRLAPKRLDRRLTLAMNNSAPIGVFDSGLGGLSVVRAITELMPATNRLLYVADTAHCPYGLRSVEYLRERAMHISSLAAGAGSQGDCRGLQYGDGSDHCHPAREFQPAHHRHRTGDPSGGGEYQKRCDRRAGNIGNLG